MNRWLCKSLSLLAAFGLLVVCETAAGQDDEPKPQPIKKTGTLQWTLSGAWQEDPIGDYRLVQAVGAGAAELDVPIVTDSYSLHFGLKLLEGKLDIVLRNVDSGYVLRFQPGQMIQLYRMATGTLVFLDSQTYLQKDRWYRIDLYDNAGKNDLLINVDGMTAFEYKLPTVLDPNVVRFECEALDASELDLIEDIAPLWADLTKKIAAQETVEGYSEFLWVDLGQLLLAYRTVEGWDVLTNTSELKGVGFSPADPVRLKPTTRGLLVPPAIDEFAPRDVPLYHTGPPDRATLRLLGNGYLCPNEYPPVGCEYKARIRVLRQPFLKQGEDQILFETVVCVSSSPDTGRGEKDVVEIDLLEFTDQFRNHYGTFKVVLERLCDGALAYPVEINVLPSWPTTKYLVSAIKGFKVWDDGDGWAAGKPEQHFLFVAGYSEPSMKRMRFPFGKHGIYEDDVHDYDEDMVQIPLFFHAYETLPEAGFAQVLTGMDEDGGSWGAIVEGISTAIGAAIGGYVTESFEGVAKGAQLGKAVGEAIAKFDTDDDDFYGVHSAWFTPNDVGGTNPFTVTTSPLCTPFDSVGSAGYLDVCTQNFTVDAPLVTEVSVTLKEISIRAVPEFTDGQAAEVYGFVRGADAEYGYHGTNFVSGQKFGPHDMHSFDSWPLDLLLHHIGGVRAWPLPFVYFEIAMWEEDTNPDDDFGGPVTRLLEPQDLMNPSTQTSQWPVEEYVYTEKLTLHGDAWGYATFEVHIKRDWSLMP